MPAINQRSRTPNEDDEALIGGFSGHVLPGPVQRIVERG
jgi:hypothetical protein